MTYFLLLSSTNSSFRDAHPLHGPLRVLLPGPLVLRAFEAEQAPPLYSYCTRMHYPESRTVPPDFLSAISSAKWAPVDARQLLHGHRLCVRAFYRYARSAAAEVLQVSTKGGSGVPPFFVPGSQEHSQMIAKSDIDKVLAVNNHVFNLQVPIRNEKPLIPTLYCTSLPTDDRRGAAILLNSKITQDGTAASIITRESVSFEDSARYIHAITIANKVADGATTVSQHYTKEGLPSPSVFEWLSRFGNLIEVMLSVNNPIEVPPCDPRVMAIMDPPADYEKLSRDELERLPKQDPELKESRLTWLQPREYTEALPDET
ncbi:hypothetical protein EHS25_004917 [Saitozyma podzolica]|uniref:Uncharacterized protein n=1 Tax=Saitozyma podzolica TaxID=1890683 RepID=A0A427Y379_9TREE|nr:hypothetical protein EHS25_004917 [Saitozyma podzolica]